MKRYAGDEIWEGLKGPITEANAIFRTSDYCLWHEAEARIGELEAELALQKEILARYHKDNCKGNVSVSESGTVRRSVRDMVLPRSRCVHGIAMSDPCPQCLERGAEPSGMEMAQREADEAAGDADPRDRVWGAVCDALQ